ncbi:MAG: phosphate ABC transporter permease PstA [Gammaproteobacteria bacterium]|jgi:phosphate transport system permease protein|nr:phosphate ABC transporter permease PstA [Gammaproteobacteria bacterium]
MSRQNQTTNREPRVNNREKVRGSLKKRYSAEKRFRAYGLVSILLGMAAVSTLFLDIVGKGYPAFSQTYIKLDIHFEPDEVDPDGNRSQHSLKNGNYASLIKDSLRAEFPGVKGRRDQRKLYRLVSSSAAYELQRMVRSDLSLIGERRQVWLLANDDVDVFVKGNMDRDLPEDERRLSDKEISWIDSLEAQGRIERRFNWAFFTSGDSRDPELAGIGGAAMGSLFTLLVTLALSFPIGIAAAVYLEEFAPKNRVTDFIEVNINNLAAVPSIVFGLLGLTMFIQFFGLPRSAPIVGGLVLALMTLPTIIIASRASLKSVPPSIREAALGMGASKMQMIGHHVLPLAMPGMLTGTIIGMAQALGESAPLLMIGMVAFIVDIPGGPMDPSTVLPVQIYLWADSPERAFVEKTSAAIMVLLAFLIAMNTTAVILRKRFERRW